MIRRYAAVLAIVAVSTRLTFAWEPCGCCDAPPLIVLECGEPAWSDGCCGPSDCQPAACETPCGPASPAHSAAGPPEAPTPAETPLTPPAERTMPPAPGPLPEGPTNDAATRPGSGEAAPPAPPAETPPAAAPAEAPPAELPPRYSQPETPPPAAPNGLEEAFSESPSASAESPAPTGPSTDNSAAPTVPSTDEAAAPPADPFGDEPTSPESDAANGSGQPVDEQPADESPAAPAEPDVEDLFGPSAEADVLGEPGGWASRSNRTWTDAAGDMLAPARLVAIDGQRATLQTADGGVHRLQFGELSADDLTFLRRQIDARRAALARRPGPQSRLIVSQ